MSTLPKMLQHLRIAAVAHGLRSSFRDWAAEETDHPREVIEAALAHVCPEQGRVGLMHARTCSSAAAGLMDDWGATSGVPVGKRLVGDSMERRLRAGRHPSWTSTETPS